MTWSPKSPSDVADYWLDWSAFLATDETIASITVTTDCPTVTRRRK